MRFVVSIGMRANDPTKGLKTFRPAKSDGFRTWGESGEVVPPPDKRSM
jgi:hypothetical protein